MQTFSREIVDAVLRHMNSDHRDDNLVIVRANGAPEATDATMTALDGDGGVWSVRTGELEADLRVKWTIPVVERGDIAFHWVKGHSGHQMNDFVDSLAVQASQRAAR